jgi:hypothetical protein
MRGSHGSSNAGFLVLVVDTLSGEVGGASLGALKDDGRLGIAGSLKRCYHRRTTCDIYGRNGVAVVLCVSEYVSQCS